MVSVVGKDKVRVSVINAMEVDGITFLEYVDDGEVVMTLSENGMYDHLGYMSICDFGDFTVGNCIRWIESSVK